MTTEAKLEAAYNAARKRELRLVNALSERPTKGQADAAWAAAAETDAARRALTAFRDAKDGVPR